MKTAFLLIGMIISPVLAQEKWAVVIGVSQYAGLDDRFPADTRARRDALDIAAALAGPHTQFSHERIYVLLDKNATAQKVRTLFVEDLCHTKPDDIVFFFFAGHGFSDPLFKRFYLLLHDSNTAFAETSSISLDQLAYFFQSFVPARNIVICLDARRSGEALGDSWHISREWALSLDQKQYLVLESSAPWETAKEGLFSDFFVKTLNGDSFLGRNADSNGDGITTVSEVADHVCRAVELSGAAQHPMFWGKLEVPLSTISLPHIEVVVPKIFKAGPQSEHHLAGFIRSTEAIESVEIGGIPAEIGLLSPGQMRKYQLIPWQYTYWFSVRLKIMPDEKFLAAGIAGGKETLRTEIPLEWSYPGWHGEWMPPGLAKGEQEGIYVWKNDQSEMVYIPEGTAIIGMPPGQTGETIGRLKELRDYLKEHLKWLEEDRALREVFIAGLEESNEALVGVAQKLKIIYDQVELFQRVNAPMSSISQQGAAGIEPPDSPSAILKEQLFIALSESLISQCYRDIRAIKLEQQELRETIASLNSMIESGNQMELIWANKTVHLPAFYMDRCEVTNQQYRKFCDATLRPYPPPPWWNEEYFFDYPDYPVVNVSWEDAMAYSCWCHKYLPTTSQWEKSARGVNGQTYPWGNEEPNQRLTNANVPPDIASQSPLKIPLFAPVSARSKEYSMSPYGCYHLAGNVTEWSSDKAFFAPNCRIARGGAFTSFSVMLCNWFECAFPPFTRRSDLGFRCSLCVEE